MRYIYVLALVGFCGPQLVAYRKNSKVSWLYGAVKIATVNLGRSVIAPIAPFRDHGRSTYTLN